MITPGDFPPGEGCSVPTDPDELDDQGLCPVCRDYERRRSEEDDANDAT